MVQQRPHIAFAAGEQAIDTNDVKASRQQFVAKVRADEPGTSGHQGSSTVVAMDPLLVHFQAFQ
jgi:hypothetical protein